MWLRELAKKLRYTEITPVRLKPKMLLTNWNLKGNWTVGIVQWSYVKRAATSFKFSFKLAALEHMKKTQMATFEPEIFTKYYMHAIK